MTNDEIISMVESFNYALDNGLPVDCCGVTSVEEKFDAWVKENFPDVHENAGDLEAYFLDEEGIEELAPFFTTITAEEWKGVMKGLRAAIMSFYSDDPGGSDSDEGKAAAELVARIDVALN